ncbi:hypothetical protein B0H13DRAFT_1987344, partial [Mycena leptocephala]
MRVSIVSLALASITAGFARAQSCDIGFGTIGTCKYTKDCHAPTFYHVAGAFSFSSFSGFPSFCGLCCSSFTSLNELYSYLLPQGIALGQQTTSAASSVASLYL